MFERNDKLNNWFLLSYKIECTAIRILRSEVIADENAHDR